MRVNLLRITYIHRWIKRLAWAAVAILILFTGGAGFLAVYNLWKLSSWEMWNSATRVSVINTIVQYGITWFISVLLILVLFGISWAIQMLLALRLQLIRKALKSPSLHA